MFLELLSHSWMYGASFENYYELQFFKKSRTECRQYLTSSLRHELTRQVNDPCEALVLKDKVRFFVLFEERYFKVEKIILKIKKLPKYYLKSAIF